MPIAEYLMPDGRTAQFQVPDGTTSDQAKAFISQIDPAKLQAPQPSQNIIEKIGASSLGNAVGDVISGTGDIIKNIPNQNPASSGLQIIGQGAKIVTAPIAQAISAAVPDVAKQGAQTAADSIDSAAPSVGDRLLQIKDLYNSFSQTHPEITKDIGAATNIAATIGGGKVATPIASEVRGVAENAANGAKGLADIYAAKYPVGAGPLDPMQTQIAHQASPEALEAGAKLHYADAEQAGASLKPMGFADTVAAIKQQVGPQDAVDLAFAGKNPVTDTLSRLDDIVKSGKPVSLSNLDNMDSRLNSDISIAMRSGDKQTASDLMQIKGTLKNSSETVKPKDLVNPQAFESWRKGDTLWSAKSKMQQLQGIIDNAYNTDNPDTAIRTGYRTLAKQLAKNPSGWTKDEIVLVQQGAKRGLTAGALKIVGSRLLSGVIGAAAGASGGPLGSVGGALAGEALGFPMRAAANSLQESRAMAPLNAVANRTQVLKAIPQSVSEIIKLPMAQQKEALDALWKSRLAKSAP